MPPLQSKQALINAFGENDYVNAKNALMNAGIRFDEGIDKAISSLTGSGVSIAKIPSLSGNILNEAAFRGENLQKMLSQPTFTQNDVRTQPTIYQTSATPQNISTQTTLPKPTGQSLSLSSSGYISPYTEGMLKNAINLTPPPIQQTPSTPQQTQAIGTAVGNSTQPKTREQILAEAARLVSSIQTGFGTLAQKGYGQTDISTIPKGVDISQLPQQSILQDYIKQSSPQPELPQKSPYTGSQSIPSPYNAGGGNTSVSSYEDTLQKALGALTTAVQPTSEETNIQDEEAKVREELRNLQLGQMQSNINVEGQPIAKPFITGQQVALEKSYGLDRLVNQSKQQTLQERLANLQARRQSAIDVAKVGIEEAKYRMAQESTQAKSAAEIAKLQAETAQTQRETSLLGLPKEMTPYEKAKLEQDTQQFGREYALKEAQARADIASKQASTKKTLAEASGEGGVNSSYLAELATTGKQAVSGLISIATQHPEIFGRTAVLPLPRAARSDAFRNYEAQLEYLKGNIIPAALSAMRAASKTGGALGQVSDREGAWLASSLGALAMDQEPTTVLQQLRLVEASLSRWQSAVNNASQTSGGNDPLGIR